MKEIITGEVRSQLLNSGSLVAKAATAYPPVKKLPTKEVLRILITGGAGFVGSNLVDRLMMQGHSVIVVDNMFTGRRKNIQQWLGHPNFQLIVHDVVEPIMMEVDQIYHLACPASPPHYQYNPIKTIKTSTEGTLNMLGLAKRVDARMLLTSTSEVYGDPEVHPQKETYWGNVNPIGPRACYDEGKRVAETMMYAYQKQAGLQVRVSRIFNTFGPRMHPNDGRVVSNFIIQVKLGDVCVHVYVYVCNCVCAQYIYTIVYTNISCIRVCMQLCMCSVYVQRLCILIFRVYVYVCNCVCAQHMYNDCVY